MTPEKVSRNAVTFRRFWTATFGAPHETTRIRPVRLVQSFESRKDAESACREICRNHPHWKAEGMCVVDLADMITEPECLASESRAYLARLDEAYLARRGAQIASEGSSDTPSA
jgi:hypothetical protein